MKLCNFNAGLEHPLFLIAGPCVIESESMTIDVAGQLKEMTDKLNIPFIFNGDNLKLIQYTVNAWDNSPMHKRQMVQPESTRAFFAAIVYEGSYNSNSTQTLKRVIFVGQFQYSKEFYLTYKGKIYPFGK